MWLERLGTVHQNIFFCFCAAVFVIVVVVVAIIITRLCNSIPVVPGQSLTFFVMMSSLMISVSVLFRGVQPDWDKPTWDHTLQGVCQVYIPMLVLGYTLFAASMFVRIWMLLLALRAEKSVVEWVGHFVLWVILMIAAVLAIIWEYTFTPNTHPLPAISFREELRSPISVNASDDVSSTAGTSTSVFECRGWLADGSRDTEQFVWRVTMSSFLALLLLLTITALPFYMCLPSYARQPKWVKVNVFSIVLVTVNAVCCVVVALVVWYQYNPTTVTVNDSNKYAIVGGLQLWMIFVAVAAILLTELVTLRMRRDHGNLNGVKNLSANNSQPSHDLHANDNGDKRGNDYADDDLHARRDDDELIGTAGSDGGQRSTYLGIVDDYDDLTDKRHSRSPADQMQMTPEDLEQDSGRGTSFDNHTLDDTVRSSRFSADEEVSTLF